MRNANDNPDTGSAQQICPPAPLCPNVSGDTVRFLKTYQGPFFAGYRVGDVRVGIAGQDQEVHYRGLLSADGTEIEGRWLLPGVPGQGLVRTEGGFVLHREPGDAQDN